MAIVRELTTSTGVHVIIRDDCIEPDQEAAWSHARAVASQVYWNNAKRGRCVTGATSSKGIDQSKYNPAKAESQ